MFLFGWRDTRSKDYLSGVRLWQRGQYNEAEALLRKAVEKQDKTSDGYPGEKLCSKHYLGRTLYDLEKYTEAEELLREAADGRHRLFGEYHEDTLWSKHWLGRNLYNQKKYKEAIAPLQQAKNGRENKLGSDHSDTMNSKYWLDLSIVKTQQEHERQQDNNQDDEVQQHGNQKDKHRQDYIREDRHRQGYTRETKRQQGYVWENKRQQGYIRENKHRQGYIREDQHLHSSRQDDETSSESESDRKTLPETSTALQQDQIYHFRDRTTNVSTELAVERRLDSFFSDGQDRHTAYTDSEINQISSLLKHHHPRWSKVPRTYVVLRTIGYLHLLDDLIDAHFSDYSFPVTERNLPGSLLPSVKALSVKAQTSVLTKSLDLEKGEDGQYLYYGVEDTPPFQTKGILGRGGFGQVNSVLSLIIFKEYARKQVLRGTAFRGQWKEDVKQFINEIEVLKRLRHRHIVKYVGSYTDTKFIALIMSPIAEMDLGAYLIRVTVSSRLELRTFFGCLATGLEYLYEQKVWYKDIKPANILISYGRVLFAGFGLSLDFTDADGSTNSMAHGKRLSLRTLLPYQGLSQSLK